ncbi:unnamed protein product [Adineta ricciae]|uniref:Uncharacterized protein n=1 Tax=Adineta ricciae TaxID=249248 RepID=A0A815UZP8_ADIRI|nr:unnamed protein product [Adineta ricciae]
MNHHGIKNEIRTQLNHRSAIHNAVQAGCNPMVCVAPDFCKGKPVEEPAPLKKLVDLSDSKTERSPGLLPLVPGMPVIITQDIAIELGLINGMNGIFRQLVYALDSVSTDIEGNTSPSRRALFIDIHLLLQLNSSSNPSKDILRYLLQKCSNIELHDWITLINIDELLDDSDFINADVSFLQPIKNSTSSLQAFRID